MSNGILKQIKIISSIQCDDNSVPRDVEVSHLSQNKTAENMLLINQVSQYFHALKDFHQRAERSSKFYRGDQWSDYVENERGDIVTEESIILGRGKVPLKNNMIGQIIGNLAGQFAQSVGKPNVVSRQRSRQNDSEMLTQALRSSYDYNRIKLLDINTVTDGMITGMFCQKILFRFIPERDEQDLVINKPVISRMFYNSDITDVRATDIRIIGELHDMTLDDVILAFAVNEEDVKIIRDWYAGSTNEYISLSQGMTAEWDVDVMMPRDPNMTRVIEVWQKKLVRRMTEHDTAYGTRKLTKRTLGQIEQENNERILLAKQNGITENIPLIKAYESYDSVWTVKYFTPWGHTLYEGETPFEHQSHPYILGFAHFMNGDAWGVVENIIDQQKYINRLISMLDFMMGVASKGVLLVPEDAIPDGMELNDFADEWSKFDGVIKFKAKPGAPLPQQVSANITNIGANEQLSIQFDLIEKISGVSGALQGQTPNSGTPSSLYAQQSINSSTNSKAMFEAYADFRKQRDMKAIQTIIQYYENERYLSISGMDISQDALIYDPERVKDLHYDVVLADGVDTIAYRMMIDEQLEKLFVAGAIDVKMYLQNSNAPFADKLLESIEKATVEQQKQAAQEQADPQKLEQVNQMLPTEKQK